MKGALAGPVGDRDARHTRAVERPVEHMRWRTLRQARRVAGARVQPQQNAALRFALVVIDTALEENITGAISQHRQQRVVGRERAVDDRGCSRHLPPLALDQFAHAPIAVTVHGIQPAAFLFAIGLAPVGDVEHEPIVVDPLHGQDVGVAEGCDAPGPRRVLWVDDREDDPPARVRHRRRDQLAIRRHHHVHELRPAEEVGHRQRLGRLRGGDDAGPHRHGHAHHRGDSTQRTRDRRTQRSARSGCKGGLMGCGQAHGARARLPHAKGLDVARILAARPLGAHARNPRGRHWPA